MWGDNRIGRYVQDVRSFPLNRPADHRLTDSKQSSKAEKLNERAQRGLKLLNDIETLREESFLCDFEVRIERKRFPVHRNILAASSDYFKAMLKTDMKEVSQGYVEIKGLDVKAVKACLDYLYSGEIVLNFDEIEPILKASDMMQIEDLKATSFGYIMKNITIFNCLQIRRYAMTYNSEKDGKATEKFIAENFAEVSKTEQIRLLDKEQLKLCLKLFKEMSKKDMSNATNDLRRTTDPVYSWQQNGFMEYAYRGISYRINPSPDGYAPESTNSTTLSAKTQWQAIANWVGFNPKERGEHLLELLKTIEPFGTSVVSSCILADPLIAARQDCMEFLVRQGILPNVQCMKNYISVENCFNLKRWAKQYKLNDLNSVVYDFMIKHFREVASPKEIGEFDLEEIQTFLFDQTVTEFDEQLKYKAIIRWTRARQAERLKYFEHLFGLLNLNLLLPDFIHNTIRKEPLVKSCPACNEKIMDALYAHTKGYARFYY